MKHSHIDPESDDQEADGEGFLTRWSRRKHAARAGHELEVPAETDPNSADAKQELAARREALNQLTDDDMPPLESLNENSDYSVFMSEKVSETLRRQALRKMFRLPGFGILDGLNDYDEDYTYFEPLGDIVTADMRFHAEREAEANAKASVENEVLEHNALTDSERQVDKGRSTDEAESAPLVDNEEAENPADDIDHSSVDPVSDDVSKDDDAPLAMGCDNSASSERRGKS